MATKPNKKRHLKRALPFPMPKKRILPPEIKGTKVEDILGKGKDLWESDKELDHFLHRIRSNRV